MIGHLHTGTTVDLLAAGSLDMQPSWLAPMKALGINIFQERAEFHGDSHQHDPGPTRLKELENYYYIARRTSDKDFLLLPGEQLSSDTYLGSAYEVLFNKPVYWTMKRELRDESLSNRIRSMERCTEVSNPEEMWDMIKRENATDDAFGSPNETCRGGGSDSVRPPDYPDFVKDTRSGSKATTISRSGFQPYSHRPFGEAHL